MEKKLTMKLQECMYYFRKTANNYLDHPNYRFDRPMVIGSWEEGQVAIGVGGAPIGRKLHLNANVKMLFLAWLKFSCSFFDTLWNSKTY